MPRLAVSEISGPPDVRKEVALSRLGGSTDLLEVSPFRGWRLPRLVASQTYGRRLNSTGRVVAPTGWRLAVSKVVGFQDFWHPNRTEGWPQPVGG